MRPFLSIGIPNYNYGRYLRQCIDSVLIASDENIEIIISDNASTDNSWAIINEYNDKRIISYQQKTHVSGALNWRTCCDLARGKYFMMLCSDDWVKPNLISELRYADSILRPGQTISFFGHCIDTALDDGHTVTIKTTEGNTATARWLTQKSQLLSRWFCMNYSMPTMCIVSTDLARKVGWYEPTMRADSILISKILTDPSFEIAVLVGDSLACQRIHGLNDRTKYSYFESYRDEVKFTLPFIEKSISQDEKRYFKRIYRLAAANALLGLIVGEVRRRRRYPICSGIMELICMSSLGEAIAGLPVAVWKHIAA